MKIDPMYIELLKYPTLVFAVLIALIMAKYTLGLSFGPVTELSKDGIKFGQNERSELVNIASRINMALTEIDELKKHVPTESVNSAPVLAAAFAAAQTVSDQTAQIASIASKGSNTSDSQQGYIWIGNYKNGWSQPQLGAIDTGRAVTLPPDQLKPGTTYQVLSNLVVRNGLPDNDVSYYEGRKSIGTLPRGTKIRLVLTPKGIDRQFAVQYWVKVESP